jgi:hypothetical protein
MASEGDWKQNTYNHVIAIESQYITTSALLIERHETVVHVGKCQLYLDISKDGDDGTCEHGSGLCSVSWVAPLDTDSDTDQIAKLKKYKSPGSDQILAEVIQAGGKILLSVIHKLINSVWNEEELPDQWKDSIIVPIDKKGDKTDCNNYRGISLLSTSYKIVSNIILSRLDLYIDEITGDHQCGFQHNRLTTIRFFCIHQILEKKWEYNETVNQLFIDFKKAYDSVRKFCTISH